MLFAVLMIPTTIQGQIEVKSDGCLYTNQNSVFLRNDATYTTGIGYGVYGSSGSAMTLFTKKYRAIDFMPVDASYTLAKFYFSSSIDYSYAYIYGDFGFNKGHWTGGINSNMESQGGYNMATLFPYRDWYGALGKSTRYFGYGYIDHLYYDVLTDISDVSVKENIKEVEDALPVIEKLRPVFYDFKMSYFDSIPEESRQTLYEQKKNSIGFIAQEVQEVMPGLVSEISKDGLLGINSIDIIPLLVKALQEQQDQISKLEGQLATLSESDLKGAGIQATENAIDQIPQASLSQNIPNPFNENTSIKYSIHLITSYAMINIYDLQGGQVLSYKISNSGDGEIQIPASALNPGLYIYNLIVDGVEVGSKRMVLTE